MSEYYVSPNDPMGAFRKKMHEEGQRELQRLKDEEFLAEQERLTKPKDFQTSADIRSHAEDLQRAATLRENIRWTEESLKQPDVIPAKSNPYELLSNEQIIEMDRLTKLEESQRDEFRRNLRSFGEWSLSRREFPATPQAAEQIVNHLKASGLSLTHNALDRAWAELQSSGAMRPDYSNRNRQAHENNVEELRSAGIQVQTPPDPHVSTEQEMSAFLRSQPSRTTAILQPRSESPDIFASPIDLSQLPDGPWK